MATPVNHPSGVLQPDREGEIKNKIIIIIIIKPRKKDLESE